MAFYSKKERQVSLVQDKTNDTVIGLESDVEGNINSNGIIKIDGLFKGDIFTSKDVIIGETGFVKGNIKANNVNLSGKMEGNIVSFELLQIDPTGKLTGDIEVKNIAISEGAIFKGRSIMIRDTEKKVEILDNPEDDEKETCYLEEQ